MSAIKARNPDNYDRAVACDSSGRLLIAAGDGGGAALGTVDLPLSLGGGTAPLAAIALNTASLDVNGTLVPDGSTYVFQAWLPDNAGAAVLMRVDDTTPQSATVAATAQRWITNGAKIAIVGPCYVFPVLLELDGTSATAGANDLLLRSKL